MGKEGVEGDPEKIGRPPHVVEQREHKDNWDSLRREEQAIAWRATLTWSL